MKFAQTISYKDISEFPGYRVGDDGSVWSSRSRNGRGLLGQWRIKNVKPNGLGYFRVSLMRDSKLHLVSVHRLVLESFVGPCPNGLQGCHNDGNPANNFLGNLRWDTAESNQHDRIAHGTAPLGVQNGRAKLNEDKITQIREEFARGGISRSALGRRFGVSGVMIGLIVRGKNWKN